MNVIPPSLEPSKKTVLLVDDHPAVRLGLAQSIDASTMFRVCGQADGCATGLSHFKNLRPDVTVADLSLGDGSGFDLISGIRSIDPVAVILVVSLHDELRSVIRALKAGAKGYLLKTDALDNILAALREVVAGRQYLSPQFASQPIFASNAVDALAVLSAREREIFGLFGQGKVTKTVAEELSISAKTVETHRGHIIEKLGLQGGEELRKFAAAWHEFEYA